MAKEQERIAQLRRRTRRPTSPGEVAACLMEEHGMTQIAAAARLGVSRATVNELLNGKRALTPDMAHRLGRLFGNGAGVWLRMQATVQLWDTLHMDTAPYRNIEPLPRDHASRELAAA